MRSAERTGPRKSYPRRFTPIIRIVNVKLAQLLDDEVLYQRSIFCSYFQCFELYLSATTRRELACIVKKNIQEKSGNQDVI